MSSADRRGDVAWLTPGLDIETSTGFGSGGRGGFLSGLKRIVGGGQLFLTQYTAGAGGGFVAFAAQLPGTIRELRVFGDSLFLAQLHGPGHVWLQSMTPAKLAAAIEPYLPDTSSGSSGDG